MRKIEQNTVLFTKDGRQIGNAIVLSINGVTGTHFIRTDYGNVCQFTEKEIRKQFYISDRPEYFGEPHKHRTKTKK